MFSTLPRLAAVALVGVDIANAAFSVATVDDIKRTAADIAWDMMQYYKGNLTGQTPGILPGPPPAGDYYWWEAGAMWGTLIDYWRFTGDDSYNDVITQALLWQVGPGQDFMPPNVTASLGNDDQGFWGMTAMTAAENNFPDPPDDQPQWLGLAQAVFNTQAHPDRHDTTCGGGLRWQIFSINNGYDYKNSIANGCFFNLGARLARYTGNKTYADWAEKTWDWMRGVGLMDDDWNIHDGAHVQKNCTDVAGAQFSYNFGVFALGAAHMYNFTESQVWKDRLDNLVNATLVRFFPEKIAYEPACEDTMGCTTDMLSFKGYVHRWLSFVTQVAPHTASTILPVLRVSAEAAIQSCTGEANGRTCGFNWRKKKYDGSRGVGQQMNALGAVSALLIDQPGKAPVTNSTGGTSKGNPNAGSESESFMHNKPMTTADRAGAGIVTFLLAASALGTFAWMGLGK